MLPEGILKARGEKAEVRRPKAEVLQSQCGFPTILNGCRCSYNPTGAEALTSAFRLRTSAFLQAPRAGREISHSLPLVNLLPAKSRFYRELISKSAYALAPCSVKSSPSSCSRSEARRIPNTAHSLN